MADMNYRIADANTIPIPEHLSNPGDIYAFTDIKTGERYFYPRNTVSVNEIYNSIKYAEP